MYEVSKRHLLNKPDQNRRQKVFSRGALHFCRGAWHSKNWQKLHWFIVFYFSIWEAWNFVWGELSPPKPHVAMGLNQTPTANDRMRVALCVWKLNQVKSRH